MESAKDTIKEGSFAVLAKPPDRVCTHISYLHHACEATVNKQRGFHKEPDLVRPPRASLVELTHQLRESPDNGLVMVLNEQAHALEYFPGTCGSV